MSRMDQDAFALRSQARASAAQNNGRLAQEIVRSIAAKKGDSVTVSTDEHPRETSMEVLAKLKPIVKRTARGNRGRPRPRVCTDGACALVIASEAAARRIALLARPHTRSRNGGLRAPC